MKILHICHYDTNKTSPLTFIDNIKNGLERFISAFIRINNSNDEHYITFFDENDNSIHLLKINEKSQVTFYTYYLDVAFNQNGFTPVFSDIVEQLGIGIVHFHYSQEFIQPLSDVFDKLDVPMIATMHDEYFLYKGDDNNYHKSNLMEDFFEKMLKIVFPHNVIAERFINLYNGIEQKSVVIPNGVTLVSKLAKVQKTETFNVVFLGRFNNEKGLQVIEEIIKQNTNSQIQFFVLGSLEKSDINIPVIPYTTTNFVEKLIKVKPDIICIPSTAEESFSYTAMEATVLGYPIITFPVGALNYVETEKRGFVTSKISSELMLAKINELYNLKLQNITEWEEIYNNVTKFEYMTEEEMIQAYQALYYKLGQEKKDIANYEHFMHQNYLYNKKLVEQLEDTNNKLFMTENDHVSLINVKNELEQLVSYKEKHPFRNLIRYFKVNLKRGLKVFSKANTYIKKNNGFFSAVKHFIQGIKNNGLKNVMLHFLGKNIDGSNDYYVNWIEQKEHIYTQEDIDETIASFEVTPKVSFLIPVYNVGEEYLRACLDSVLYQYYTNWELCIADDCSTEPHIKRVLTEYMEKDSRIKVVFREKNGHISEATNSVLAIATGEYIALLDNDDFIKREALLEVVKLINKHPDADMIYTDEDKVNIDGTERKDPFFKPDWSPDSFMCHMYLCHLGVYRRKIALEIGGFRTEFNGSQDYDFALRFSETTNHIYHVPKILYHWRMLPTSTAAASGNKNYAYDASIRTKKDAMKRKNINGIVNPIVPLNATNIQYLPDKEDYVSIIIPTKNQADLLGDLLDSLYNISTWKNFEIIVVDNGSTENTTVELLEFYQNKHENFKVLHLDIPFNYSKLNNEAAKIAKGNFLMFLNNDTKVITPHWMENMIGHAKLAQTGAVGARLLYEDNTIQHAGIVILNGRPAHAYNGFNREEYGYFGRMQLNYNYLAVSAAALMVEKSKFEAVSGFDENLKIAYNDVDLCLKLYDKGYYNVCHADIEFYHYESKSRGYDLDLAKAERLQKELAILTQRWEIYLQEDPFYNKNLTQHISDFTL